MACGCGALTERECAFVTGSVLQPEPNCIRRARLVDGWTFMQASHGVPAVWGEGEAVLWASGEPFLLVGPDGVGKTSLAQQIVRSRIGLGRRTLAGLPVTRTGGRTLYIAADRPSQAARSFHRMCGDDDEEVLRDRLVVHRGPLPFDVAREPLALCEYVESIDGIDTAVIDSLKDIAIGLASDEVGNAVNVALGALVASGVETLALHHQRKQQQNGGAPKGLQDVYGSRWLTAGAGSVALLWGEPGDSIVEFRHLKQPAEPIGPLRLIHDHDRGRTLLHEGSDLEQRLHDAPEGLTVKDAACLIFGTSSPTPNQIESSRRKLNGLIGRNRAERKDDGGGTARYFPKKAA